MDKPFFPNTIGLPQMDLTSMSVSSQQSFLSLPTVSTTERTNNVVDLKLENSDIWKKFHQFDTEMIITKPGRRMFPTLRYQARGLELDVTYAVYLQLRAVDEYRYKYSNGKWSVNGRLDIGREQEFCRNRVYMHPDSPATGRLWMKQPISFHKIKLTNNNSNSSNGLILLNSMHKYRPVVYVVRVHNIMPSMSQVVAFGSFEETEFMAVTAYQNDKITQLKIDYNPFAKGFREHGKHEEKRRCPSVTEVEETAVERDLKIHKLKRFKNDCGPQETTESTKISSEKVQIESPITSNSVVTEMTSGNSSNASTPIATVWNPLTTNWTLSQYGGQSNFQLSPSLPAYPPLADWVLHRPYPILPINPMITSSPWMYQGNFGYLY